VFILNGVLLNVSETAEVLRLSPWTIRKYINQRKINPVRIGRRVLIEYAELERLIAQGRQENIAKTNRLNQEIYG
jgi:excisionase family DNA binding protein